MGIRSPGTDHACRFWLRKDECLRKFADDALKALDELAPAQDFPKDEIRKVSRAHMARIDRG